MAKNSTARNAKAVAAKATPAPEPVPAASLESLDVALRMLAGFQHRHKNQHRLSTYWWSPFQQLRRHAAKLRDELQLSVNGSRSRKGEGEDAAVARARWMLAHDVPKAYLAFSRLVADKQFAQLGVLLLGILAQIRAVLVQVGGPGETEETTAVDETVVSPAHEDGYEDDTTDKAIYGKKAQAYIESTSLGGENDLGEAVAREAEIPDLPDSPIIQGDSPAQADPIRQDSVMQDKSAQAEQKKSKKDKNERKEGKAKDKKEKVKKDRKEKDKKDKKNKKRKRGDEFDDLFSGLL